MQRRRGISPILSVIILISIAVVGGVLVFNVQNQFLITGLSQIDLQISELSIQKDAKGSCYLQGSVQNSGTEAIETIILKTTLDSGEDFHRSIDGFGANLVPNNSTELFELIPYTNDIECGNFTLGSTYSFRINATSADSSFATIRTLEITNVTKI